MRSACITCQGQTRTAWTKECDQKKAYTTRRYRLQWGADAPAALPIPAPPAAPAPPTADAIPAARRPVMDRDKCMRSGRCDSADSVGMASLCTKPCQITINIFTAVERGHSSSRSQVGNRHKMACTEARLKPGIVQCPNSPPTIPGCRSTSRCRHAKQHDEAQLTATWSAAHACGLRSQHTKQGLT